MNDSIYKISLDIHETSSQHLLHIKKNDTGRKIVFTLTENGLPYKISSECTATFRAKKPDGNILYNNCVIADNKITYTLTQQTSASVGIEECEVTLYGANNKQITSPRFSMVVEDTLYSDNEVESTNEFTQLTQIYNKVSNIDTSESARVSAENARVTAESTRVSDENTRKSAETSRATAETARVNAESSRATAETARVNAESSRVTAETARVNAESSRVTAETARASAETTRQNNEDIRQASYQNKYPTPYKSLTTPSTISDSLGGNIKVSNIIGKSIQNGAPTPTAPIAIQNVGNTLTLKSGISADDVNATTYTIPLTDINGTTHIMRQYDEVKKHEDGKWYFDCNSVVKEFNGTETWGLSSTQTDGTIVYSLSYQISNSTNTLLESAFCNRFQGKTGTSLERIALTTNVIFCKILSTTAPTVNHFKALLANWNTAGNPLIVLYQTATTTSYELSASTSAILNAIAIQKGNANIYFTNTVAPIMTADYFQDLQLYCNSLGSTKVDKVTGKGLSTNDYSDTEKAKVDSALQSDDIDQTYSATSENAQSGVAVAEALQNQYQNNLTTPATVADSNGGKLLNADIVGKSIQDGTPTPTAPIEIQNTGNSLSLVSCGKNLFDFNNIYKSFTDGWGLSSNGYLQDDYYKCTIAPYGSITYANTTPMYLKAGKYYISTDCYRGIDNAGTLVMRFCLSIFGTSIRKYANATLSAYNTWQRLSVTIDITTEGFYFLAMQGEGNTSQYLNLDCRFKNIVVSSVNNIYEPYQGNIYTIPLTDTNGTSHIMRQYDEVKKHSDGKWYFDCNSVVKEFNGTETWIYGNSYFSYVLSPESNPINCSQFLSTKYKNSVFQNLSFWTDNSGTWLRIMDSNYTTVDTWKAQLATWNTAGNPLTFLYQTATTTSYELSATTSAILDSIAIQKGNANIYFTNAVVPTMTADYPLDLKAYIDNKFTELQAQILEG